MEARNRIRINQNIDIILLDELRYISQSLDFPQSRILEFGMKYTLKKQLIPSKKTAIRSSINLTINKNLWDDFKIYSKQNNIKLVHLLEESLRYSMKKFKKDLKDTYN
ncbi:hypothetical protein [Clostridium sp. BL-8]|uniref:hypothetical protein n=1 Tax=Clostridium sp. BL-8 TaxID=349938 RepID=UPI00098BEBB1|nr:hypothetical protein [Clostridium sp. BL-8]OOM79131.1 hypothetical protein CLOBL_18030 [Clostridium sp. BL-8]